MFVVKRPFRSFGKVFTAGTVVVPAEVKRFKGKLAEGKIIVVTERNYEDISTYFKSKYGIDLPPIKPSSVEAKPEAATKTEAKSEVKPKAKVKAKASVTTE